MSKPLQPTPPAHPAEDGGDDAPILIELRLQLEATADPIERSVLRIRQGLYLARTNRLGEARAIPQEIHATWDGQEQLRVFVWLWVLEGVLAFYETSRTGGRQRLLQAQAAAQRAGFAAEAQIAAAWLAHLAYVDSDYPAMLRWLGASALGAAVLEEARARSSLTLACALQLCGEQALASAWFARAREVARRTGDRAGIMAATANRVMLKLNDNWLCLAFGEPLPHDNAALRQELNGILGYERLSGSESLREQNDLAQLRLAVLRSEEPSALEAARNMNAARDRHSAPSMAMAAVIEHWLAARSAPAAQAREHLQPMEQACATPDLDDDDAAACWALTAQAARLAQDPAAVARLEESAQQARRRFRQAIDELRPGLLALESEASGSAFAA